MKQLSQIINITSLVDKLSSNKKSIFESLTYNKQHSIVSQITSRSNSRIKALNERKFDIETTYVDFSMDFHKAEERRDIESQWLNANRKKKEGTAEYKRHYTMMRDSYFKCRKLRDNIENYERNYSIGVEDINRELDADCVYQLKDLRSLLQVEEKRYKKEEIKKSADNILRKKREEEKLKLEEERRQEEKAIEAAIKININNIKDIIKRRKIKYLVHFTPINNLHSILEKGLLSRSKMSAEEVKHVDVDAQRIDHQYGFISTTISFPNYKMFYMKQRYSGPNKPHSLENLKEVNGWVVLLLKPSIMWMQECKFLYSNAASGGIRKKLMFNKDAFCTYESLEGMFYNESFRKNSPNPIPDNYTTDPQAELLVKDKITQDFIDKIIFKDQNIMLKYKPITDIECTTINKDYYFSPRRDWHRWQSAS